MDKEDFIDRINKAANIIHNAKLRNNDNYIIVSPEIANKLVEIMKKEQLKNERIEKLKKLNGLK